MTDPYADVQATRDWWALADRSVFHHAVSLVTAQEVRFEVGRNIRKKLYAAAPGGLLTPAFILSLTDDQLKLAGLSVPRWATIRALARCVEGKTVADTLLTYSTVFGIGPWTLKGLKIIFNVDSNIVLYEDKWIRARLAQLVGVTSVSEAYARDIFLTWKGHETLMSYFFWRLKPTGADKLRQRQPLTRGDFV